MQAELNFEEQIERKIRVRDYLYRERIAGRVTPSLGASSDRLAIAMGFSGGARTCRIVVHELRMDGIYIGSNDTGYFFALNAEEILPTIRTLLAKARETGRPARSMLAKMNAEQRKQIELEFSDD